MESTSTKGTYYLLITVITLLMAHLYIFFKNRTRYWQKSGVFSLEPTPLLGNAKSILLRKESLGDAITNFYNLMKSRSVPYGGYYFLTKPMFVPASIDLIKSIMIHDFEYFTDRLFHSHEYDPFSMHLLALRGEQWKRIRSKLSPVFTPLKVKMIFPVVVDTANELVGTVRQHLKHTNVVEIHHTITNFTIDAITAISFGVNPETLKNGYSEFKKVAEKWFSESIRDSIVRLLMVTWPDLLTFFKVRSVHKDVANFFSKMATDVIDYREKNDVIRQDLLQFLLQIRRDKSLPLTVSEIIAQCIIFFIAGYETTASVITFCLYELALDQKIQQKVREEAKNRGQLNYDVLQRLPYLDKCIKETSRKYPPLPVHFRVCTKDYKVPNTELMIEKGTAVIIPVSAVHYDSDFYKKPQEFNPERFSSNKKLQCVWSPFGDGPRMCLGSQIGMLMSKLAVASLVTKFKFTINSRTDSPISFSNTTIVLRSVNGIWLNVEEL